MVTLTIDGRTVQAQEGATILEAAAQADIHIPHLCYLKGINEIAACRVCCVEVDGERAMVTACNNPVKEGMVVHTNSPRVRTTRRINVELILSQHDCKCATCVRSGNCQLQTIANDLGIVKVHYETQLPRGLRGAWTTTFPLYHDYNKCIKCMRCIQVCDKVQTLSIWDVSGTGGRTMIDVSGNRVMKDSDCALCGQCITHCPTGGVMEAALRTAAYLLTGENPAPDAFADVRTGPGLREATYEVAGIPVRCAVVSGLGNARALMEQLKAGRVHYDFVEVMACPGGCVGGGGQPISCEDKELYGERGQRLYALDKNAPMRFSHENPQVQALYQEYLGAPLSEKAEELLHTDHEGWKMPGEQL